MRKLIVQLEQEFAGSSDVVEMFGRPKGSKVVKGRSGIKMMQLAKKPTGFAGMRHGQALKNMSRRSTDELVRLTKSGNSEIKRAAGMALMARKKRQSEDMSERTKRMLEKFESDPEVLGEAAGLGGRMGFRVGRDTLGALGEAVTEWMEKAPFYVVVEVDTGEGPFLINGTIDNVARWLDRRYSEKLVSAGDKAVVFAALRGFGVDRNWARRHGEEVGP